VHFWRRQGSGLKRTAERDDAREAADIAIDIADNLRAELVKATAATCQESMVLLEAL